MGWWKFEIHAEIDTWGSWLHCQYAKLWFSSEFEEGFLFLWRYLKPPSQSFPSVTAINSLKYTFFFLILTNFFYNSVLEWYIYEIKQPNQDFSLNLLKNIELNSLKFPSVTIWIAWYGPVLEYEEAWLRGRAKLQGWHEFTHKSMHIDLCTQISSHFIKAGFVIWLRC